MAGMLPPSLKAVLVMTKPFVAEGTVALVKGSAPGPAVGETAAGIGAHALVQARSVASTA